MKLTLTIKKVNEGVHLADEVWALAALTLKDNPVRLTPTAATLTCQ